LEGPFFHIGDLTLPDSQSNSSKWCILTTGFERCFENPVQPIGSLIVRVAGERDPSLRAWVDGICYQANLTRRTITAAGDWIHSFMGYSFMDVVSFGRCPSTSSFPATILLTQSEGFTTSPRILTQRPFTPTIVLARSEEFANAHQNLTQLRFIATMPLAFSESNSHASSVEPHSVALHQSTGSKVIGISVGVAIAAGLVLIGGFSLLLVHFRRALSATADASESEDSIPVDCRSSITEMATFMSGDNVLSHDLHIARVQE
jgi:hypothetical protein